MYHFRGFVLFVWLDDDRTTWTRKGSAPGRPPDSVGMRGLANPDLEEREYNGQWWVRKTFLRIDGINDRKERMEQYWETTQERFDRINERGRH